MADQNENRKPDEITLDDVELAIRILEMFMEKYKRAERVLSRLESYQPRGRSLEERIAEMVLQKQQLESQFNTINTVEELTEEEKQRIEELKKRYLSK